MGKRKEKLSPDSHNDSIENSLNILRPITSLQDDSISTKKSKKHKRKKSSKKEKHEDILHSSSSKVELIETLVMEDDDQEVLIEDIDMEGDESLSESTSGTKLFIKTPDTSSEKSLKAIQKNKAEKSKSSSSKKVKKRDGSKGEDDTDSEEERWLDAIESGKLEEVDDELKRIKNPRLMTARQRALMEKRSDGVDDGYATIPAEPLLALPSGFKEKVLTEEMIAKKAIKSKRRREQAIEKREEEKKKTVDRLLKKQDSKISKSSRSKTLKKAVPLMSYLNNQEGFFLSLPIGMEIPSICSRGERNGPKPVVCGVEDCFNLKKYSCSKSGIPLCSLECYKKNMTVFLELT